MQIRRRMRAASSEFGRKTPLDLDAIGHEDFQRQAAGHPPRFAIPRALAVKPSSHVDEAAKISSNHLTARL